MGAKTFFDNIDPVVEGTPKEEAKKQVLVLITSDRGLCGAVHTSIVKEAKNILNNAGDKDIRVVAIGDKSRAGLQRLFGESCLNGFTSYREHFSQEHLGDWKRNRTCATNLRRCLYCRQGYS